MLRYNDRSDRELKKDEKKGIEDNLLKCIGSSFGEPIAMTYRPIVKRMVADTNTRSELKEEISKLEKELKMVLGEKDAKRLEENIKDHLGYNIYTAVEIESE